MSGQTRAQFRSHGTLENATQALDRLPAESAFALERWLDALAELPLDGWIAAGQACARDAIGRQRRATASALLEALVADQQFELTAWFIGDMVETAAYSVTGAAARRRRSARRDFAMARAAADWAALAIATETWLPAVDRDALCAPFDAVMRNAALRLV